jgi:hypothetical protein
MGLSPLSLRMSTINIVRTSRKETLMSSVSDELLPFVVGQSRDSFTLLRVKDVMLFQHCQQVIHVLCTGCR